MESKEGLLKFLNDVLLGSLADSDRGVSDTVEVLSDVLEMDRWRERGVDSSPG